MYKIFSLFLINVSLLFLTSWNSVADPLEGQTRKFSEFEVFLPQGWDGDEQSGFITDNRDEYVLSLTRKNEKGDRHVAQVSIYLLPNPAGHDSEGAANILAQSQQDSTPVIRDGIFYVFKGEPRTNIVHGPATTRVKVSPQKMLIIIAQNTDQDEEERIISSLNGLTDVARELLNQ